MAMNTFESHLSEVGTQLESLRDVIKELELLLKRHDHNNYTAIIGSEFDTEAVTKAQYDAAISSIDNLIDTWLPSGHGTNIDEYLYEVPEVVP
ncbi:MAG: hypothetical protein ACYTEQ_26780 [Planctomycetota bacterium]|jgi:hypothetical protein